MNFKDFTIIFSYTSFFIYSSKLFADYTYKNTISYGKDKK